MILIIDVYEIPAEKIIQHIYGTKMFKEITEKESVPNIESGAIFQHLNAVRTADPANFFVRSENYDCKTLSKLKYYFDEVCEVSGTLLKITEKKKREVRFYDIVRDEKEIVDFVRIKDDLGEKVGGTAISRTIKPYLDAQEDEVVLFPSDEE